MITARELRNWIGDNISWKSYEKEFGYYSDEMYNEVDDRVSDCNIVQDMVFIIEKTGQVFLLKIKEVQKKPSGLWE